MTDRARRAPRVPEPLRRLGRALGVPVTEVTRYWSAERISLRRGLVALLLAAVADLFAGLILGGADARLERLPGLLVLIPAAIAMRGATFGALGARLGTAILTGQFDQSLRPGSYLFRQIEAAAILTLVTSLEAAVLAKVFAQAIGLPAVPIHDLVTISVVGGLLASVLLLLVTVALARASFTRGWNMDDVAAPTITATGDLLAVPAILLATLLVETRGVSIAVAVLLTALTIVAVGWGLFHPRPEIRRLVRESGLVLTGAAAVSVLAGMVVESRSDSFLSTPALLVLFPPFVAMFGSLGGVLSSRLTSKLHLGQIEPRLLPQPAAALDFSVTYLFALVIYTFVGASTWVAATATGIDTPQAWRLIGASLTGGLLGTTLLSAIAYSAATMTHRFGLDPDNHAIPIVTSVMDLLGMLCLVTALALFGIS